MLLAPARELPQIQLVGLAGQSAVGGEEPGQGQPLRGAEHGRDRTRTVEGVVVTIGHLRGTQAETRGAGPAKPQQTVRTSR